MNSEQPNIESDLRKALEVLREGGIILYPTDTIWGLGCDASRPEAVRRIFEIKKRADAKSVLVLVDSLAALERCVEEVPEVAYDLLDAAVDPLTVIYDKGLGVAPEVCAPDGSLGVRITSERFSRELCRRLRRPIVSTSANVSGAPAPQCFVDISPEILEQVDYIVEYRRYDSRPAKPSGIIRLGAGGEVKIIR